MSTYFVPDNAEFRTTDQGKLKAFLEEREASAIWYTDEMNCKADKVRFEPIFAEPIAVGANVDKLKSHKIPVFTASEEAYADTMDAPEVGCYGTTQMLCVNGNLHPVGDSAISGIVERAGMKAEGWEKLKKFNPATLSEVLNDFMKATPGFLTILVEDEKVRAVNSGRYAICPMTSVLESMSTWVKREYPKAVFLSAYANHSYTTWTLNLEAYTDDVFGHFSGNQK